MSVIAWDGKTLAADKRCVINGLIRTTTKIFSVDEKESLVAFVGDADFGELMLHWYKNQETEQFPTPPSNEAWGRLIVFSARVSTIFVYERTKTPVKIEDRVFAAGSGRDFAIAAMHLGKSAKEAVEIAMIFDANCGNGVDILTHNGEVRGASRLAGEASASTVVLEPRRRCMTDDFEKWWQEHGQFCRAGGGEYEKTFAFRAWEAAVSEERAGCVEVCRRRAKAMQETIRAANPRTSEHLMLRRDARMEEARECANEIIERSNY